MVIREVAAGDFDQIWPLFEYVVRAGETYAYDRNTSREQAEKLWLETPRITFVAEEGGTILGTYYLKTNQAGPGKHVCNCGYMVAPQARGKGVATRMCQHSLQLARDLGYKAMQFNFVASTNTGAIRIWSGLGFEVVGRLPRAFNHPEQGYVDALVMYQWLD